MVETGPENWESHASAEVRADNEDRRMIDRTYYDDPLLEATIGAVLGMRGLRRTVQVGAEMVPNKFIKVEQDGDLVKVSALAEVHWDIQQLRGNKVLNTEEMAERRVDVEYLRGKKPEGH